MVDFDVNKSNIKNQEIPANPAGSEEVSVPKKQPTLKLIFEQKMTRQQVSDEFGQVGLDIFDKANVRLDENGKTDDIISKEEYMQSLTYEEASKLMMESAFERSQQAQEKNRLEKEKIKTDLDNNKTSKQMDIETLADIEMKKNPGMTKEAALKKVENERKDKDAENTSSNFSAGMSLLGKFVKELHTTCKNIDISKVNDMTEGEKDAVIKAFTEGNYVRIGMTREMAEKAGGQILEAFNKISSNGEVITKNDYALHVQNKIKDIGVSNEQIFKMITCSDKKQKAQLSMKMLEAYVGDVQPDSEYQNVEDIPELYAILARGNGNKTAKFLDTFKYENAAQEQGKMIFDAFYENLKNDLSDTENSAYRKELERLKNGEFSEHEKKKYGLSGTLGADELEKYAKLAVYNKYLANISEVNNKIFKDGIDEDKLIIMKGVVDGLKATPEFKELNLTLGLNSFNDKKIEQEAANYVAQNTEVDDSRLSSLMLSSTVISQADEESVKKFIENNASQVEMLESVAHAVLQTMPEGENRTQLETVINQTIEDIYNGTIPGYTGGGRSSGDVATDSSTGGGAIASAGGQISETSLSWSSNPMTTQVFDTRQANAELRQEQGIVDYSATEQAGHISANRIGTELSIPEPIRYNPDRVKKLLKDFNNSINTFDSLTSKEQQKVDEYFHAASPSTIVSIMVQGNNKVQKFLLGYVSTEEVAKNIKKKDDIKNLIPQIQANLADYQRLNVEAGIRKVDQMTEVEKEIYKLNENFA